MDEGTLIGLHSWCLKTCKKSIDNGGSLKTRAITDLARFNEAEANSVPRNRQTSELSQRMEHLQCHPLEEKSGDPERGPRKKALILCQDYNTVRDPKVRQALKFLPSVPADCENANALAQILKFDEVRSVTDFEHAVAVHTEIGRMVEKHNVDGGITRRTIKTEIDRLKEGAKPGDTLMFYYAGHGSKRDVTLNQLPSHAGSIPTRINLRREQTIDPNGKRYITGLCTSEGVYYGLKEDLTKGVPTGVTVLVILDACHSGTTMNLEYRLDNITSPGKCQWVKRQSAPLDDQSQGPLVLSFASSQKAQVSTGLPYSGDISGGLFTNTMKILLQRHADYNNMGLFSVRNLFSQVSEQVVLRSSFNGIINEQDLVITSNNKEIDLTKITLPDLVRGGPGVWRKDPLLR